MTLEGIIPIGEYPYIFRRMKDPSTINVVQDNINLLTKVEPAIDRRIDVLGTDLSWRYTIGREGSGDGEFNRPWPVAAHGGELSLIHI